MTADDARAAYGGPIAAGVTSIVLAGDSGGGGLALGLLARAADAGRDQAESDGAGVRPAAAVLFSPWTDLALTGESFGARAAADPILSRETLDAAARLYAGALDRRDPRLSPLFGDVADLPPVLVHVGEDEVLLDDGRRYVERRVAAGGAAECHVWAGVPHVFPSASAFSGPPARRSTTRAASCAAISQRRGGRRPTELGEHRAGC